ncbi:hypothetical protein OROGR_024818 [Orobanche gracilis]
MLEPYLKQQQQRVQHEPPPDDGVSDDAVTDKDSPDFITVTDDDSATTNDNSSAVSGPNPNHNATIAQSNSFTSRSTRITVVSPSEPTVGSISSTAIRSERSSAVILAG